MSGPIVRTGTTPEFWKNWDQVFGEKSKKSDTKANKKTGAGKTKAGKPASEKKTAEKAVKKTAKKSK